MKKQSPKQSLKYHKPKNIPPQYTNTKEQDVVPLLLLPSHNHKATKLDLCQASKHLLLGVLCINAWIEETNLEVNPDIEIISELLREIAENFTKTLGGTELNPFWGEEEIKYTMIEQLSQCPKLSQAVPSVGQLPGTARSADI